MILTGGILATAGSWRAAYGAIGIALTAMPSPSP
jgi:hypothetical protein